VVQEFIHNALQHGKAKKIHIQFILNRKLLKLLLSDNGKGFTPSSFKEGMGLKNIQTRIKSYNGEFHFQSEAGKGTSYRIEIPMHATS
jgi:two-component system, NarL family, sensor kinase